MVEVLVTMLPLSEDLFESLAEEGYESPCQRETERQRGRDRETERQRGKDRDRETPPLSSEEGTTRNV